MYKERIGPVQAVIDNSNRLLRQAGKLVKLHNNVLEKAGISSENDQHLFKLCVTQALLNKEIGRENKELDRLSLEDLQERTSIFVAHGYGDELARKRSQVIRSSAMDLILNFPKINEAALREWVERWKRKPNSSLARSLTPSR